MVKSCGGMVTPVYLGIWDLDLWEILEVIELVRDLHDTSDSTQLWNSLAGT